MSVNIAIRVGEILDKIDYKPGELKCFVLVKEKWKDFEYDNWSKVVLKGDLARSFEKTYQTLPGKKVYVEGSLHQDDKIPSMKVIEAKYFDVLN